MRLAPAEKGQVLLAFSSLTSLASRDSGSCECTQIVVAISVRAFVFGVVSSDLRQVDYDGALVLQVRRL